MLTKDKNFYENEGKKIYSIIKGNKQNDEEQATFLLNWCSNNLKKYYCDVVDDFQKFLQQLINNNLSLFIPFDCFKYSNDNLEKYFYIIQDDLSYKLLDILKKYYTNQELNILTILVNNAEYKLIWTMTKMDRFDSSNNEIGKKYHEDMFNFSCFCHDNFIHFVYIHMKYYLEMFNIEYNNETPEWPTFHIERYHYPNNLLFKKGFRSDLNRGFRSAWEANFARVLNYLNINYDYENQRAAFKLTGKEGNEKYKFASAIYLPDFILEDGTIIEIKGEINYRSLANIALFRELYPEQYKKLKIIDHDIYYLLNKKYKDKINNWESDSANVMFDYIPVVGINRKERIQYVKKLSVGDELLYYREPDNEYDLNAIKITDLNNNTIGYIASDYANYYSPKIDAGIKYKIFIKSLEKSRIMISIIAINLNDINISNYLNFL